MCVCSWLVHHHSLEVPDAAASNGCCAVHILSYTRMDGEGWKGQRCCYCSTKAHGHIKSLSSGWAESKLANILRLSQHCPMKSDWLHTSKCVCTRLCIFVCVCVPKRETGRQREPDASLCFQATMKSHSHRRSRLWYNWKSAVKDAGEKVSWRRGGVVTEAHSESRKAVGCWMVFYPLRGPPIMNGRNSRMGGLIGSNRNLFVV